MLVVDHPLHFSPQHHVYTLEIGFRGDEFVFQRHQQLVAFLVAGVFDLFFALGDNATTVTVLTKWTKGTRRSNEETINTKKNREKWPKKIRFLIDVSTMHARNSICTNTYKPNGSNGDEPWSIDARACSERQVLVQ